MRTMTEIECAKQKIFDLALQIARLQCHNCYLENEQLVLLSRDDVESYIRQFRQQLEFEAKNVLMIGDWRNVLCTD